MFFVLSGYLVTQHPAARSRDRRAASAGRRFYARRVRRILPGRVRHAARHRGRVRDRRDARSRCSTRVGGFRAAFLYVANWYFIRQSTDYFAAERQRQPGAALLVARGRGAVLPRAGRSLLGGLFVVERGASGAGGGGCCASSSRRLRRVGGRGAAPRHHEPHRAYYGTDTRAYQLLAGALLALTPQLLATRFALAAGGAVGIALALAGLVVLATSLVDCGPITRGVVVAGLAVAAPGRARERAGG